MNLTLAEAAHLLGKSPRHIRYLLKSGKLQGRKVEGRWTFDAATLPAGPERQEAKQRKAAELGSAVEEALGPHLRPPGRKAYSVADLVAFRTGTAQGREAAARLGREHAAVTALRSSLVALAQGCHRFHTREKAAAFQLAREHAAEALTHLHLDGSDTAIQLAGSVEQQYLAAIVGLLRRQERKERR